MENTRKIINNTPTLHDTHLVLRSVFVESMGEKTAAKHHLGSRRGVIRAKEDYKKTMSDGFLVSSKKLPRSRSYVDHNLISNAIDVIASCCSTTTWTMKCFDIRSEKIERVKDSKKLETMRRLCVFLLCIAMLVEQRSTTN